MLPSNSVASCSWHLCYHYPIPTLLHSSSSSSSSPHKYNNLLLFLPQKRTITASSPSKFYTHFTKNNCFLTLTATNSCSKEQKKKKKKKKNDSHPTQNHASLEHLYSSIHTNKQTQYIRNQEANEETSGEFDNREVISTNMWWADLKAALGQRINLEGIVSSLAVVAKDRHLALPHISVPDIRYLDWAELKAKGFQGVVFDKDNTITVPYSSTLWPPLGSSLERCKLAFGNEIAVFSNSAGLHEYDSDGWKAKALESAIGIKVIRHRVKKPAGTAEEIEKHFGCESSRLIMVGDRPFTDIVYGNRNGFLTVLTEPLSLAEEPFIVKQVRKLEVALVKRWCRKGLKSTSHMLLPNVLQCVRDPPPHL